MFAFWRGLHGPIPPHHGLGYCGHCGVPDMRDVRLLSALLEGDHDPSFATTTHILCPFFSHPPASGSLHTHPPAMGQVRHAVWREDPTPLSVSISFLTDEYHPTFFFWEQVCPRNAGLTLARLLVWGLSACQIEMIKKLVLVGLMSIIMRGAIYQLIIAFVIVLCFMVALLTAKPYKRPEARLPPSRSTAFMCHA